MNGQLPNSETGWKGCMKYRRVSASWLVASDASLGEVRVFTAKPFREKNLRCMPTGRIFARAEAESSSVTSRCCAPNQRNRQEPKASPRRMETGVGLAFDAKPTNGQECMANRGSDGLNP